MSKGYTKHANKEEKFDIVKEFASIQKAAYEAKYASQQAEKMYNSIADLSSSLNDIVCGAVDLLIKKGVFTQEELDESIKAYVARKTKEVLDLKTKQMGYVEDVEKVEEGNLIHVNLDVKKGEEHLKDYPRKMFLIAGKTYLFPGLEGMLLDSKVGDVKEFILTMPEDFKIIELRNQDLSFKVEVLIIRKKFVPEVDSENKE